MRFSLRTATPEEVRERQATALAYLEKVFKAARSEAPIPLSRQQCVALSQSIYEAWSADPGVSSRTIAIEIDTQTREQRVSTLSEDDEAELLRTLAGILDDDRKDSTEEAFERLEDRFHQVVDRALDEKGIRETDQASRRLILREFARSASQGLGVHTRKLADGDYSPDPNANRFPQWTSTEVASAAPQSPHSSVSLVGLPNDWWQEASRTGHSESTREAYTRAFRQLSEFVGHDDASRISTKDIISFKDHRLTQVSARTVADGDLPALKSIFEWAVKNLILNDNPARDVAVAKSSKTHRRMRDFTIEEASAILSASDGTKRQNKEKPQRWASRRWAPWLCAYSGARVGEVLQLRKADIITIDGHVCMKITPEAVTVKGGEERIIPLHPHIIEKGFMGYVEAAPDGPLFMWTGTGRSAWRTSKNKLREFIRKHVSDPSVQPSHGWRHTFKTIGREVGIESDILDAICGHRPATVGKSYGEFNVKAMTRALQKFPKFNPLSS
ncbi:phage integrase N-terminal SAM-like domain-containing protein [Roseibium sp. TrichSKD4]|uniref:phage integrase N-terminal SAM-like domain-containing protein n=1 Tax=Roseibium sp. TrichSKD4 TaxID=744980 RepID=UPI00143BE342|nr:tyrosine-type recombinase/integrase [Roseibium sp. TrichSKD4]